MPTILRTQSSSSSGDARIVVVASKAMSIFVPKQGLVLDKMKTDGTDLHALTRYGHSKLANVMFARKLSELYPAVTSVSLHPGTVKSEIWDKAQGIGWFIRGFLSGIALWYEGVTNEVGAKGQLWASVAKVGGAGNVENGKFYDPIGKENPLGKIAGNQAAVDELWKWTEDELKANGGPGWPKA